MQSVQQQFESNLFTAARHGRADFCREILRRGSASVNARDSCGRTPAHEAARNGHVNVLNVLCECGADLYARSTHGVTIAHQAAFGNHTSFLQELHALLTASGLSEGAQLHQKDDAGRTPLDVARESGCHSAAAFLVALLPPGHPKLQELQPNGATLAQDSISRSTPSMQTPAALAQVHTQAHATAHTATQLQLRAHAQMQAQGHEDSDGLGAFSFMPQDVAPAVMSAMGVMASHVAGDFMENPGEPLGAAAAAAAAAAAVDATAMGTATDDHAWAGVAGAAGLHGMGTGYAPGGVRIGTQMHPHAHSHSHATTRVEGGAVDSHRRIGAYTIEERQRRIQKFRDKRLRRVWKRKVKYDCRKKLAEKRPRVKGRFVKRGESDDDDDDASADADANAGADAATKTDIGTGSAATVHTSSAIEDVKGGVVGKGAGARAGVEAGADAGAGTGEYASGGVNAGVGSIVDETTIQCKANAYEDAVADTDANQTSIGANLGVGSLVDDKAMQLIGALDTGASANEASCASGSG